MRQHVSLTGKIIDETAPPKKGEIWLADKTVKGFGLRLWATKSGGQKAYAIRTTDIFGNTVRKTYNIKQQSILYRFNQAGKFSSHLDEARKWARDEINKLKGRSTTWERKHFQWHMKIAKANDTTLRSLIGKEVRKLKKQKGRKRLTENYINQLEDLFFHKAVLSDKALNTTLEKLSDEQIVNDLVQQKFSYTKILIARAFITRIFKEYSRSEEEFLKLFRLKWEQNIDIRFPELRNFKKEDYQRIFKRLEQEEKQWQQALCIRLYFIFGARLQSIMSAKWHQFYVDRWFPYLPEERSLWFEAAETISDDAKHILQLIADNIKKDFVTSEYLFPSNHAKQFAHIQTVQHFWKKVLRELGIKYYPLREFAMSFRSPKCPSYFGNFLRSYGSVIRHAEKAEQLAKIISSRSKKSIDSSNY